MEKIFSETLIINGERRIILRFRYDQVLIDKIKKIPGRVWSDQMCCWHVPDTVYNRNLFKTTGQSKNDNNQNGNISKGRGFKRNEGHTYLRKDIKYNEYKNYLKNLRYSENTIETYCNAVRSFFEFVLKTPENVSEKDFQDYNYRYLISQGYSRSMQNAVVSAIKLYYKKFCNRQIDSDNLERPRKQRKLPIVLSNEEVGKMVSVTRNTKHRLIICLLYSAGLRMSELLNLKIRDIDSQRMLINIRQGKGFKDRVVTLSPKILKMLREYYKSYKPEEYIVEGPNGGQYSSESVGKIVKKASRLAGIKKRVSAHTLRHSYATHLLESGVDLRYIQELLGHNSSRTTEIYTHVSNRYLSGISSPIDKLLEDD